MRYIRIQKVVKTICNDDVKDLNVIKNLLEQLKNKELFCSITLGSEHQNFPKTRIFEIKEQCFGYRSFFDGATIVDYAEYKNIKELKIETTIEKMTNINDQDSRWNLLDFE